MSRNTQAYTILDGIAILTANFTAATTDIITSNAHGLANGNMVVLTTTDTLPAGLSTGTVYYVIQKTTNTFKLSTTSGTEGTQVNITDTGTGTHTFTMHDIGKSIFVKDFRNCVLAFDSASSANVTTKFQASRQATAPDFSAAQSPTNSWDYIQVVDLEDGSAIDGDTGIALSGTDTNRTMEVNINGINWVNAILSSWVAGTVTLDIELYDNQ